MPEELSPTEYVDSLCNAIGWHKCPLKTYDFSNDGNRKYNKYNPFKGNYINPPKNNNSILDIEEYIGTLLNNDDPEEVINGLLNILYWSSCRDDNRRYNNINRFYENKPSKKKIIRLQEKIREWKNCNNNEPGIVMSKVAYIHSLNIHLFGSGVTNVSMLLMFINPESYPAINPNIKNKYGVFFEPFNQNQMDADVYEKWVYKCQTIAKMANQSPCSPCEYIIRAVDVERALDKMETSKGGAILSQHQNWDFTSAIDNDIPICPNYHSRMINRKDPKDNSNYWWCFDYPECTGKRNEEDIIMSFLKSGDLTMANTQIANYMHDERRLPNILEIVREWAMNKLFEENNNIDEIRSILNTVLNNYNINNTQETNLIRDILYLRAISLRMASQFDEADNQFEELIGDYANDCPVLLNELWIQRALAQSQISRIEALYFLPDDVKDRNLFAENIRIAQQNWCNNINVEDEASSLIPRILMALPEVVIPQGHEQEINARNNLNCALDIILNLDAQIQEHENEFLYKEIHPIKLNLSINVKFYSTLISLRDNNLRANAVYAANISDDLLILLENQQFTPDLVIEAVYHALDINTDIDDLVLTVLTDPHYSHQALQTLEICPVARRSNNFRGRYIDHLLTPAYAEQLTPDELWVAWESLLIGCNESVPCDTENAQISLDQLENLAFTGNNATWYGKFITLLNNDYNWQNGWDEDTYKQSLHFFREKYYFSLINEGNHQNAEELLLDTIIILHATALQERAGDNWYQCIDILDYIDELQDTFQFNLPNDITENITLLRAEHNNLDQDDFNNIHIDPIHIIFVGGNERHQRYPDNIRAQLENEIDFELTFTYYPTYWGNDWPNRLDVIANALFDAHAIVIRKEMKTGLGRALRQLAGEDNKPWIPCTSNGQTSMKRSILEAARVVIEQRNAAVE